MAVIIAIAVNTEGVREVLGMAVGPSEAEPFWRNSPDSEPMPPDIPKPAYFIAHFHVPDIETYRREYGRKVLPQLTAAGAKLLVACPSPTVLEGDWQSTWTAVIEFPDRATALRWYQSQEYAPLKLRLDELTTGGTVVVFDAYQSPALLP